MNSNVVEVLLFIEKVDKIFDIGEFQAEIAQSGILRPSKFTVEFPVPNGLLGLDGSSFSSVPIQNNGVAVDTARRVSLLIESAPMPGTALATHEVRRYGVGHFERKPYVPIFTDINMVFRSDMDGNVWHFLRSWLRLAVNYEARDGFNVASGIKPYQYTSEVAYKADYAVDMQVTSYRDDGQVASSVVLREAFPIFVAEVPLSWAAVNDYIRIPVTISYFDLFETSHSTITGFND